MFLASLRNRLANQARLKRFERFKALTAKHPKPVQILDLGGTQEFWEAMGFTSPTEANITLFNITHQEITRKNFTSITGDAADLSQFKDQQFDIVFSNSVIEHLGRWEKQKQMAEEINRVGKSYFIQTPNYGFPIEPHLNFLGFHYLPRQVRIWLLMQFDLGHYHGLRQRKQAEEVVDELTLLKIRDMKKLFPKAEIKLEKWLVFNKSIMAIKTI